MSWDKNLNLPDTWTWLNSTLATLGENGNIKQANISQLTAGLINMSWHLLLEIIKSSEESLLNKQLLKAKVTNYIDLYSSYLMAIIRKDVVATENHKNLVLLKSNEIFSYRNHVEVFWSHFSNTREILDAAAKVVIDNQGLH